MISILKFLSVFLFDLPLHGAAYIPFFSSNCVAIGLNNLPLQGVGVLRFCVIWNYDFAL